MFGSGQLDRTSIDSEDHAGAPFVSPARCQKRGMEERTSDDVLTLASTWQLNPLPGESPMHRREFLERSSAALAGAAMLNWTGEMQGQTAARTIGIQVGAVSFLDEGTDRVLDLFVENGINTLFLAIFTYGRGIGGRQPRGTPLPDHGTQEYDDE